MIIIPEIKTVLILVPRTGSGFLKKAVKARYPEAMQIYRHMEADGVPHGYDNWARVGVIRHPVDRLWSLYKFLKNFGGPYEQAYIEAQRASAAASFDQWVMTNSVVFTSGYDSEGLGRIYPKYMVLHPIPETRKSQRFYLRPDLGTEVHHYEDGTINARLGIEDDFRENQTAPLPRPAVNAEAREFISRWFKWDLDCGYTF